MQKEYHKACDFHFGGIVSQFNMYVDRSNDLKIQREKNNLAAGFQKSIVHHLVEITSKAIDWCKIYASDLETTAISGEAIKNNEIKKGISFSFERKGKKVIFPDDVIGSHAISVAYLATEYFKRGNYQILKSNEDKLLVDPQWKLTETKIFFSSIPKIKYLSRKIPNRKRSFTSK